MTRVVILGGGFGGVYTAQRLLSQARRHSLQLEVHLVNRENYMVFQPMLAEVISGSVGLADTVSPLRRLAPGAHIHVREVEYVDFAAKTVVCSPGFRPKPLILPYDHLVVALGNATDFRGLTGLAEHAMPFKTLGDALALRNHTLSILEAADSETDQAFRRELLTFVVAGGGFSGVEALAELNDFVRRALSSYPRLSPRDCTFMLLHSRDRILPEMDPSLATYAQKLLGGRGVDLRLNTRLKAATAQEAILGDGTRIATRTLVSTVPANPNRVVEMMDLPKDRGSLLCEGSLRLEGSDHIWALGDCARIPLPTAAGQEQQFAPPTAQHATREATVCADNIIATLTGKPLRPFNFPGLGSLAALGHRKGVANLMGFKVSGLPAWFAWRTVYWMKMPGLDRKARVGLSWLLDLIFQPDIVELRTGKSSGVTQAHFEPGETIFEQGDLGDRVYIIVKGKVEVVRSEPDGPESILATLGPGQYFGEMALLHRAPRNATVRCREALDVLLLEKGDFTALVSNLDGLRSSFENTARERSLA